MKLRNAVAGILAAILLVGSGVTDVAYAMEVNGVASVNMSEKYQIVEPFWQNIFVITPSISAKGTLLYPTAYIEGMKTSGKISGTMYLERYSYGKWVNVSSWSISGTGYVLLSKTYAGVTGSTYRTRVSVQIDGETAEAVSSSVGI